jgi:hypothetical protein
VPTKDVLGTRSWERSIADTWLTAATAAGSARYDLLDDFCAAVEALIHAAIPDGASARAVISELLATQSRCDTLPFETGEQCLAYICWHLGDRYGRTQQALDALFSGGHLPLRHRGVTVLEVGAGPAPAVYAIGDYYRHLAKWCRETNQPKQPVGVSVVATVDRGPAWGPLVHRLSELRGSRAAGNAATYGTTYMDLRAFSVRRLHQEGINRSARQL